MSELVIDCQLDKRQLRDCVAMLNKLGYWDDDQRGNISNYGFAGMRRYELNDLGEKFGFKINPDGPAIETARYFETLFLQGKFGYEAETAEERMSPRQLMAEAKVLKVSYGGQGEPVLAHAALSLAVGKAKALLYEQAGALNISITDKNLGELAEAVRKESDHGSRDDSRLTDNANDALPNTDGAAPERVGEAGDSGGPESSESWPDDQTGTGRPAREGLGSGRAPSAGQKIISQIAAEKEGAQA